MFTGIIEALGKIEEIHEEGSNHHIIISSDISRELKVDQSVAHDGVCLTVTAQTDQHHQVTAIRETLDKSNLRNWKPGHEVNLERCMKADGRFDGHIVQGHVDGTATVAEVTEEDGSWLYRFKLQDTSLMVDKGSICINGTSLTCFDVESDSFKVAIIPYTYHHTNFNGLKPGDAVNLEFDVIGKYVRKMVTH
jgi:riboflavin synthase